MAKDPRRIPSPLVGEPAPPFTLHLLTRGTLTLDDLRGKIVVLNFWASWCYPACWNEAPRLQAAWERYERDGWLARPVRNLSCLALFLVGGPSGAIRRLYGS